MLNWIYVSHAVVTGCVTASGASHPVLCAENIVIRALHSELADVPQAELPQPGG